MELAGRSPMASLAPSPQVVDDGFRVVLRAFSGSFLLKIGPANCQLAVAALSGNEVHLLALRMAVELAVAVAAATQKGSWVRNHGQSATRLRCVFRCDFHCMIRCKGGVTHAMQ